MPPQLDKTKCDGCGICVYQCGTFSLEMDEQGKKARLARGELCVDCCICELKCPEGAISIRLRRRK